MNNYIRLSTRYLGFQLFTFFINFTGWDSIGFSWPFWILYIIIRELEKKGNSSLLKYDLFIIKECKGIVLWIILDIIMMLFSFREAGALKLALYYIVGGVFFIYIYEAQLAKHEIAWLIKMYTIMAVCASILLIIQRAPVPTYTNRISVRIFGKVKDPNYFSAYLMLPCIYCLNQYMRKYKIIDLLITILISVAILLTGSRSSFLSLSVGLVIVGLSSLYNLRSWGKVLIIGTISILVVFVVLPDNVFSRLTNLGSYNDGSNRLRYNIWSAGLNIWKEHPIFGAGQNVVSNHGTEYGAWLHMMTHSTWIDNLAEFGLFGFLVFIQSPIKMLILSIKQRDVFVVAALVTTIATATIISAQYSQYYWVNLALLASITQINSYGRDVD